MRLKIRFSVRDMFSFKAIARVMIRLNIYG